MNLTYIIRITNSVTGDVNVYENVTKYDLDARIIEMHAGRGVETIRFSEEEILEPIDKTDEQEPPEEVKHSYYQF